MGRKFNNLVCVVALMFFLAGCVGTAVNAVSDTAISIAKIPFKVAGATIDVLTPDGDDDSED